MNEKMEKMKKMAAAMNRLQAVYESKAAECAALVIDGQLTLDEAAVCLAGADLKEREALREDGFHPGPGGDLDVARVYIQTSIRN